ncbi:MAG: MFS transporter [Myxococcales bacterium]|nr:MFS transporter [Myxococcales bacterium]
MKTRTRVAVLGWAHLLNDGSANYLPGILPLVLTSLDVPRSQAGVLMGVLLLGQGLQPLTGILSDAVGGRKVALGGIIGTTITGALIGMAPSYPLLLALLVLLGITNSCFHPQALAGVRALVGPNRAGPISVFLVGGEVGRGVWPLLAGFVVTRAGLHGLWLLAIPAALSLPLIAASLPSLTPHKSALARIDWRPRASPLARVIVFTALRVAVMFTLVTYLPLWWTDRSGSLVGGAGLVTTFFLASIVGNLGGGYLIDRLGVRPVATVASFLAVVFFAVFLWLDGAWVWLLVSLIAVCLFATFAIPVVITQALLPESPSLGSGIAIGLCNAIGATGVMGLGLAVDALTVRGVLWVAVGIGVAATLAAFWLPEPERVAERVVAHQG